MKQEWMRRVGRGAIGRVSSHPAPKFAFKFCLMEWKAKVCHFHTHIQSLGLLLISNLWLWRTCCFCLLCIWAHVLWHTQMHLYVCVWTRACPSLDQRRPWKLAQRWVFFSPLLPPSNLPFKNRGFEKKPVKRGRSFPIIKKWILDELWLYSAKWP